MSAAAINRMQFSQIDATGCQVTGAILPIGNIGPKHYAVIIGRSIKDQQVYVAESMHYGYQIRKFDDFVSTYRA